MQLLWHDVPAPVSQAAALETQKGVEHRVHCNVACRRKDIKNPRVKNKMRFDKKSKARRGQVQEVRERSAAYGGEATGIKAGVSKSRRF